MAIFVCILVDISIIFLNDPKLDLMLCDPGPGLFGFWKIDSYLFKYKHLDFLESKTNSEVISIFPPNILLSLSYCKINIFWIFKIFFIQMSFTFLKNVFKIYHRIIFVQIMPSEICFPSNSNRQSFKLKNYSLLIKV